MGRYSFLFKFTRPGTGGTGTDAYRSSFSCIRRVAEFLDITDKVYTPSEGDQADRAGYTRSYTKADGTTGTVTVAAGKRTYLANSRAGAKKIQLTTGGKTTQGTKRTLSFTFPSFATVAEITDALGEIIPSGKISRTGTVGASEIEPFFSIKGGGTYAIIPNPAAIADTQKEEDTTEAEQVTIVTTTKSRKRKQKSNP